MAQKKTDEQYFTMSKNTERAKTQKLKKKNKKYTVCFDFNDLDDKNDKNDKNDEKNSRKKMTLFDDTFYYCAFEKRTL